MIEDIVNKDIKFEKPAGIVATVIGKKMLTKE